MTFSNPPLPWDGLPIHVCELVEGITHPFPRVFFAPRLHAYHQPPAHLRRVALKREALLGVWNQPPPTPLPLLPPFPLVWL